MVFALPRILAQRGRGEVQRRDPRAVGNSALGFPLVVSAPALPSSAHAFLPGARLVLPARRRRGGESLKEEKEIRLS